MTAPDIQETIRPPPIHLIYRRRADVPLYRKRYDNAHSPFMTDALYFIGCKPERIHNEGIEKTEDLDLLEIFQQRRQEDEETVCRSRTADGYMC